MYLKFVEYIKKKKGKRNRSRLIHFVHVMIHWLIKNFVFKKGGICGLLYIGVNVRHNLCPFEGNCLTPIQQFSAISW